jgi:uncharacterized protein YbbC (DUF1343 family)/CubicO group peptidase (beta-lactamase class C family)
MLAASALSAQSFPRGAELDRVIGEAIAQDKLPGAVLVVGHRGQIVWRKAYGKRALTPRVEAMTADTIFDVASLTKVIGTTPALMKLFEQGRFRLNDKITDYIPEFQGGKSAITIRNLMTHFSGLEPDVPLKPAWTGYEKGIELACKTPPAAEPGVRFVYSDINFILLGELVRRLSGERLEVYAAKNVFEPLGMRDTMFLPPASLLDRIAPTERLAGASEPLRGVVHDPTARNMGGVAGHAGLFSTGDDLARFAQMMLDGGGSVLSPLTVRKFTEPQSPPDQPVLRGLGWDIDSPNSGNRGELFPIGSYGHTGFTGTSIWIDPASQTYVILLANSVHPKARPALTSLRARVATIVAGAVGEADARMRLTGYNETYTGAGVRREVARNGATRTGLDVMAEGGFSELKGLRVGLITNQSGISRDGRRNVDLMRAAGVEVAAIFSPEHGFAGAEDRPGIADSADPATGIRVYSLYGKTLRPTPAMLAGLGALVFDIQDVGVHFYTYETTLGYALEAAAQAGIPVYVLDRPNPITGVRVEGPLLDQANVSFTGYLAGVPVRHGLTMGELAQFFNGEKKIGARLTVVPMRDWSRGDWFDSTGLMWVNPSPNLRSLGAAMLYPGLALFESSPNWSVGRGTAAPFEQVGAAFVDGVVLAAELNRRQIPGVRVYPTRFTPTESNYKGTAIEGVRFVIVNRELVDSVRLGLEVAVAVRRLYPGKIDFALSRGLIGSSAVVAQLTAGASASSIMDSYAESLAGFVKVRDKYLLYK